VAALAADAGLSCVFWSIVDAGGRPVAEMALPAGSPEDAGPIQMGIFRILGDAPDVVAAAAKFRARAVKEFAGAQGLPEGVQLYLPWFCTSPAALSSGSSLAELLTLARLPASRVIVEVAPEAHEILRAAEAARGFRSSGLQIALRIEEAEEDASDAVRALEPDYIHFVSAEATSREIDVARRFLEHARRDGRAIRLIAGGTDPFTTADMESLGVSLFYGEAISKPRFLC
jgi:hypothetical protein